VENKTVEMVDKDLLLANNQKKKILCYHRLFPGKRLAYNLFKIT